MVAYGLGHRGYRAPFPRRRTAIPMQQPCRRLFLLATIFVCQINQEMAIDVTRFNAAPKIAALRARSILGSETKGTGSSTGSSSKGSSTGSSGSFPGSSKGSSSGSSTKGSSKGSPSGSSSGSSKGSSKGSSSGSSKGSSDGSSKGFSMGSSSGSSNGSSKGSSKGSSSGSSSGSSQGSSNGSSKASSASSSSRGSSRGSSGGGSIRPPVLGVCGCGKGTPENVKKFTRVKLLVQASEPSGEDMLQEGKGGSVGATIYPNCSSVEVECYEDGKPDRVFLNKTSVDLGDLVEVVLEKEKKAECRVQCDATGIQTIDMDTSCSKQFYVGQDFGALVVHDFPDFDGCEGEIEEPQPQPQICRFSYRPEWRGQGLRAIPTNEWGFWLEPCINDPSCFQWVGCGPDNPVGPDNWFEDEICRTFLPGCGNHGKGKSGNTTSCLHLDMCGDSSAKSPANSGNANSIASVRLSGDGTTETAASGALVAVVVAVIVLVLAVMGGLAIKTLRPPVPVEHAMEWDDDIG
eukprot:m.365234 g.365234  ORF g.365234 m.365234 type:complete len:518 (+) comp16655_c0_seq2:1401-2954(+)